MRRGRGAVLSARGLQARFAGLTLFGIKVNWRTGEQHCELRLAVDDNGYQPGGFSLGQER